MHVQEHVAMDRLNGPLLFGGGKNRCGDESAHYSIEFPPLSGVASLRSDLENTYLEASVYLTAKSGTVLKIEKEPIIVKLATGEIISAVPTMVIKQERKHVFDKYPFNQGFHTKEIRESFYHIKQIDPSNQKKEVVLTEFDYDGSWKTTTVDVKNNYVFSIEKGYDKNSITLLIKFKYTTADLAVIFPKIQVNSQAVPLPTIRYRFLNKWTITPLNGC